MTAHRVLADLYTAEPTNVDPGDAGYLSNKNKWFARYSLVTAAAETRTLKTPLRAGLIMSLTLDTDGGNCVVTSEVAINSSGNTIMTFADARDTVTLISIEAGGSFYWSVLANDGASLS